MNNHFLDNFTTTWACDSGEIVRRADLSLQLSIITIMSFELQQNYVCAINDTDDCKTFEGSLKSI